MLEIILAAVLTIMTTFMTVKIVRACKCSVFHFGKCKLCHLDLNTKPSD